MHALPQIRRQRLRSGRRCPPWQRSRLSLSFRTRVCHPNTRRHVRLLGPCFKTGRLRPLCQHPRHRRKSCRVPQSPSTHTTMGYNTLRRVPHSLGHCTAIETDADPSARKCTQREARLIPGQRDWHQAFPFQQFHVLFNSLSKVLFIFPSRYLFTISLSPVFSFRWNLPPILSCIPKQLDLLRVHHIALAVCVKDRILTLYDAPFQETCARSSVEDASLDYNLDSLVTARFKIWAFPASLTVTRGILVSFFSSAYWYA